MSQKFLSDVVLSTLTAGSILKLDANGKIVEAVDGTDYVSSSATGYFTASSGSGIYYSGDVRIGTYQTTVAPDAKLHIFDYQTTEPKLLIEDGNTGDASMQFKVSTQSYTIGIDNSNSDKFVLSAGSELGTGNLLEITSGGLAAFQNSVLVKGTLYVNNQEQIQLGATEKIATFQNLGTERGYFEVTDTGKGYFYADGFKTGAATVGFLKSDGTVDTGDFFSGAYVDLTGTPTLGTMAAANTSDYKTSDEVETYVAGELTYTNISGTPTLGTAAATDSTDYATAAQGALADSALQSLPSHNHDARYYTETEMDGFLSGKLSTSGGSLSGGLTINEGNLRIVQDASNIAQVTLGEDPTGNHVILEYDGTGSGDTNYFYLYSGLATHGWAAKGSSLNMQPSTGKIAIGTTTFTEKFNVDGNVRFTGTISASGYNKTNWDTAFDWGNHASEGYLTSYTETSTLDAVADRGRTTNQQLISTNPSGFRVDSGSYARIELDSNNSWSYIRFQDNGVTTWDIATLNNGNLEWRPNGGDANRMLLSKSGELTINGPLNIASGDVFRMYRSGGSAHQRADARLAGSNQARIHWYGKNDAGATANFKHAWYDGANYINVTATNPGRVTFGGSAQEIYIGSNRVVVDDELQQLENYIDTNFLSDIPDNISVTSITVGGTRVDASTDRPGLLEIERNGTNAYAGIMTRFSGTAEWALMGDESAFGLYDDENNDWAWRYTENSNLVLYSNGVVRAATKSDGFQIKNTLELGALATTDQGILKLSGYTANKESILKTTNGNLHIDSADGHSLYLNYYTGTTDNIMFGNGNGGNSGAKISNTGVIYANGGNSGNWNTAYGWGNHASAGYLTIGQEVPSQSDWQNATMFYSEGDIGFSGAGNHSLQVVAQNGNDAFMAFHIHGDHAVYLGLENGTNRLYTGGWSLGSAKYQIWDSRDFDPSDFATSSHTHTLTTGESGAITAGGNSGTIYSITSRDTRAVVDTPTSYNRGLYLDFKNSNVFPEISEGGYKGQMIWRSYGGSTDISGGLPLQIVYTQSEKIYYRLGNNATTWNSQFKTIATGDDIQELQTYVDDNFLSSVPSTFSATAITLSGIKLEESSDRPGILEVNRDGSNTWSGIMTKFSGTAEWALMGNESSFGLYDDQNNDWAWRYIENGRFEANYDGGVKFQTTSTGTKSIGHFQVAGTTQKLELGEFQNTSGSGRTVLIEGKAGTTNGEGSGRIFFSENNTTAGNHYGLSLYYEGDDNAVLPSGFNPNTGNATWSLRVHNASVNGTPVISGSRTDNNVYFGGNLFVPNVIYHTGDTDTYMQFHAANQWRVVTGGAERLEVNNTNTTVQNKLIAANHIQFGGSNQGYTTSGGTYGAELRKIKKITLTSGNSNWDGDSHSITSRNIAGADTDSISINSYNDITLRLDSNNNNTTSHFYITDNTLTGTSSMMLDMNTASNETLIRTSVVPYDDRQVDLGRDSNRWRIIFCEVLDSAGLHEKNLQNPEGEKQVGEYETGTVLVWKDGKNVPCTEPADHMRMGIAVKGVSSPLVQGAEPVLCTGEVNEGDYLVTSSVEGHAAAITPQYMRQHNLFDCVLGKALEGGNGDSHIIKTWVNI